MLPDNTWGPATFATLGLLLVAAIGGLVQVIRGDLQFDAWLNLLQEFAIAAGILGVGRAIYKRGVS